MKKLKIQIRSLLILLFCFSSIALSQPDTSIYIKDPDRYVAEQLLKKRIVMLGDFAHNTAQSLHTPISVLNEWLELMNSNTYSNNLVLILECSPGFASDISNYIITGDFDSFLNLNDAAFFLEDLEYYSELCKFYQKLISSAAYKQNRIKFEVKGFEIEGTDWNKIPSEREKRLWFVNYRDTFTCWGITDYLNQKQEENALIFYGAGHLIKEYYKKNAPSLNDDERWGYYLAHYLKQNFGDENVLTVNQFTNPASYLNDKEFEHIPKYDVYTNSINIPWKQIDPQYYDAFILRKNQLDLFPHRVNLSLSRSIVEKYISDPDTSLAVSFLNFYFELYIGKTFNNKLEIENWYNDNKNSISIDLLETSYFREKLFSMYYKDTSNVRVKNFLNNLGFRLTQLYPSPDSVTWWQKIWPEEIKHIRFINALGVYWIGYPDEKITAKKYLYEFSGQDFNEPAEYFKWYRKKYYDYDF